MKLLVYVFGLVALSCICSASDRDALIRQMVNDLDADGDGFVTENELHSEFVISMDTNSNWIVTENEFINLTNGWPAFYGDSLGTAKEFFNNLDVVCMRLIRNRPWSSCGSLGPLDLIEHFNDMDVNKDGQVSVNEGYDWMDTVSIEKKWCHAWLMDNLKCPCSCMPYIFGYKRDIFL